MSKGAAPFWVDGEWRQSGSVAIIRNPFDGRPAGEVFQAAPGDIEDAIAAAVRGFEAWRQSSAYERNSVLRAISAGIEERKEDFARLITLETGKPIALSRSEVDRTVFTFSIAADESRRIGGEVLPLDLNLQSVGKFGITRRFPLGPVAAITPFNFPLNLVAHKVAPAIAAGNSIILKPSSSAPQVALLLAEVIAGTSLPKACFNVIPCAGGNAAQLIEDQRVKLVSFTGSPAVGWPLKGRAGKKRVTLELGGNAGVIVEPDADLKTAIPKIISGGFANAGQSCIAVQRVYIHRSIWEHAREQLLSGVARLPVGDPFDERTIVGPMITEDAARKIESWIAEGIEIGAKVVCGGGRKGAVLEPTIIEEVPPAAKLSCLEVFAPLITIEPYEEFGEALVRLNASAFGLQAGIFTSNLSKVVEAYRVLDVGGLVINDVPTYRIDHMPYGGVKDSGFGREGIRYAIEEMTELKLLVVNAL
jgi:acyl-CoA reductase-like NAD-dependent aldehyde dehydrogenase